MTDITNNTEIAESNSLIADELEDIALVFSMLEKNNLIQALQTIDKGLARIDNISLEQNANALRAISHWMGLNLELNDETQAQITTLIAEDSFTSWIDILASVLRNYDPVLLPQLHQSLTSPQWPIKPSAPLLKGIAIWIEGNKAAQDDNLNRNKEDETTVSANSLTEEQASTPQHEQDYNEVKSSNNPEEEFQQKHVFEEVDLSILNKNYNYCTDAILKELKEHPDFKVSLIEIDKTGLTDLQDHDESTGFSKEEQEVDSTELFDNARADNTQSDFALEVDDIVMTLSASSSMSTKPLDDIDAYIKELSRLSQLADISNYQSIVNASNWCQRNLRLFKENQNGAIEHFVKSGECWSWIELLNLCMSNPEEVAHLATLTNELKREEWLEHFEDEALETLLLEIKQDTDDNLPHFERDNSSEMNELETLPLQQGNNNLDTPFFDMPELESNDDLDIVTVDSNEISHDRSYETSGLETCWHDDIHPELLSVYLAETPEQITKLTPLLSAIFYNTTSDEEKYTAARMAHTIKGGSAVVGITILSEYAHKLETLLDFSVENQLPEELLALLPESGECLEKLFEAVQSKQKEPKEFLSIYNKLTHYVDHLEDYRDDNNKNNQESDNEELEAISPSALPDFIQSQNSLNDSLEHEIFGGLAEDSEQELEEAILKNENAFAEENSVSQDETNNYEIFTSSHETLEDIKLPDEIPNSLEKIVNDNSLEDSENENCINEISVEIDDIVMNLTSITLGSEDVFQNIESYTSELDRFDILAEISGYPELSKLSQWCQANLAKFTDYQTETAEQFITSGECWAWLEHLGICLNEPDDPANLASLTSEIIREEWTEAFDINELQNVLLALRNEETFIDESDINQNIEQDSIDENIEENTEENNKITANQLPKAEDVYEVENVSKRETVNNLNTTEQEKIDTQEIQEPSTTNEEVISWDSDIHPELLSTYFQETPDQVSELAELLHKISNKSANKEDYKKASRIAHTIKGASGVVGLTSLVDLTHKLEDILDYSVNNELPEDTANFLAETSDCLEGLFETIQNKQKAPDELSPILEKLSLFAEQLENNDDNNLINDEFTNNEWELTKPELPDFIESSSDSNNEETAETPSSSLSLSLSPSISPLNTPSVTTITASTNVVDTNLSVSETHIRVPVDIIDKLLNLAGELVTTSTKVSDQLKQTGITNKAIQAQDTRVHKILDELSDTIYKQDKDQQKMLSSLKESDFDTLEMDTYNELHSVAGLLTESILDSETIEKNLSRQLSDIQEDLRSLDKLNKELSNVILSSRMVSINTLIPRLERIVRQTCRKTGKKAELLVTGNEINIDTDILNGLVDPLLHLLRNAIDHGIETPEQRVANNKNETGVLQLDFSREGNHILMQLKDDGAGIDPEFIYQRAIDKAIITPDQEFSPSETLKLILRPGFSTQENVSEVSGRGVGMDVVNSSVERLKGELQINSEKNQGTRFNVRIPLTLITNTTLLVNASNNPVAIASENIDQILYLAPDLVIEKQGRYYVNHNDEQLLIHSLSELLNWPTEEIDYSKSHTLLLIKDGGRLQAVQIEEIIYSREVVVKSLEPWINSGKGITGACHLNDGGVAPVINLVNVLKHANESAHLKKTKKVKSKESESKVQVIKKILVVDDSLSNRKALSLIIEQTDYEVLTAVDGLDALQVMNDNNIDMVFTDLEMPRMNGLEFTQAIRAWNDKKETPVVMITSRTTAKHRNLAEKAGVDDYLTKPVVTDTLLESIDTWLKQNATN
ncbi:Hpt domain-containing protein [uncultured Cocleimonas sp.]|uniref:hybrid sensor histidine kinase/response regulator n=1 Tax=uncultured Cocleimonas sp. TaxID=1051587 RepID=UPI002618A732|nr:Hpt domain-containing protein [uncultured Cocleimonas sp.]